MTPRICPKSNTVHNAQGSQSWRIDLYVSDPTRFKLEYHQRSIIEAVWRHQKDVREPHQVPQARARGYNRTRDPNISNETIRFLKKLKASPDMRMQKG